MTFKARAHPLALQLRAYISARHQRLVAGGAVAMALATGGAFAVVGIAPTDAEVPVQTVAETVQPLFLLNQLDHGGQGQLHLHRSTSTRLSDTVELLLSRLDITDPDAVAYFRNDPQAQLALASAGRLVKAQSNEYRQLTHLSVVWPSDQANLFTRLKIDRTAQGFRSHLSSEPVVTVQRFAAGTISSSLFAATDAAGIPDAIGAQIAEVFAGEIDFYRSLRKGDQFSVVYELQMAEGEPLRTGKVLATEFTNAGKTLQAVWFEPPGGKGGYFTPEGQSMTKAFLASPMEFSRVTSGFAMRLHPISKLWKAHLGVDYGAPTGTPVRSVGAGVVTYAGVKGGFGNVIEVDHGKDRVTVYAHLSKINVKKGQAVEQGYTLGAVGATGWATGPHLHFEFRSAGKHLDPLLVAKQAEVTTLTASLRPAFDQTRVQLMRNLRVAKTVQLASAQ